MPLILAAATLAGCPPAERETAVDDGTERWRVFAELLSTPRLPSGLDPCPDR